MKDKNILNLTGKVMDEPNMVEIKSEHTGKILRYVEFHISSPRFSGVCDELQVTVEYSPRSLIKCGDHIDISGELHTLTKKVDGKNKLFVFAYGKSYAISKTQPEKESNYVDLQGYVVRPNVYRITPFGKEIADLLIANNQNGESYFIPCIVWGRNAEFAQNIPVGSKVEIIGRLQSRDYQKCFEDGSIKNFKAYEVSGATLSLIKQAPEKTDAPKTK